MIRTLSQKTPNLFYCYWIYDYSPLVLSNDFDADAVN